MAAPKDHWKLGLFVLSGVVLALGAAAWLGAWSLHPQVGRYVSYFDESVQGLEVGSPIKFRGVTIGSVSKIDVAVDHRHVEVTSDLGTKVLSRLGLDVAEGPVDHDAAKKLEQAIDLRAQLASAGVTGVKFLQLDFFTVADHPAPVLPFAVPRNYIPATSSTMKDLEDSVVRTMNDLPMITQQVASILRRIDLLIREVSDGKLIANVIATLAGLQDVLVRVNAVLVNVDGDKGLLQSVQRGSSAFGDAARTVDGLGGQLEATLVSVQEAAKSVRKLAGALEQEPDMLIKGRMAERER
jgi:phospholipid/cholesterol/gamma-HCH transport system substrate-binding protein